MLEGEIIERYAWVGPFLETFRISANVSASARAAKVNRWTPYDLRNRNPDFASLWNDAEQEALDSIELTVFNLALGGDRDLAKFYLRNRRPEVWNKAPDLQIGTGDGPLQIEVRIMELPAHADV